MKLKDKFLFRKIAIMLNALNIHPKQSLTKKTRKRNNMLTINKIVNNHLVLN